MFVGEWEAKLGRVEMKIDWLDDAKIARKNRSRTDVFQIWNLTPLMPKFWASARFERVVTG